MIRLGQATPLDLDSFVVTGRITEVTVSQYTLVVLQNPLTSNSWARGRGFVNRFIIEKGQHTPSELGHSGRPFAYMTPLAVTAVAFKPFLRLVSV